VRPRARLLPLGSRHRSITQADSPPARVGRRRAPKSTGTRGNTMGSPYQATPVLRHAFAGDETRDLGCQPPHMRLTDVEDAPDASPRKPKTLNPPACSGRVLPRWARRRSAGAPSSCTRSSHFASEHVQYLHRRAAAGPSRGAVARACTSFAPGLCRCRADTMASR
jgi:hypothetical protein